MLTASSVKKIIIRWLFTDCIELHHLQCLPMPHWFRECALWSTTPSYDPLNQHRLSRRYSVRPNLLLFFRKFCFKLVTDLVNREHYFLPQGCIVCILLHCYKHKGITNPYIWIIAIWTEWIVWISNMLHRIAKQWTNDVTDYVTAL